MLIVDAHCHVSPCWYEPVASLLYQMDRNHVAKAVLIQIQGQFDNGYQFGVSDGSAAVSPRSSWPTRISGMRPHV